MSSKERKARLIIPEFKPFQPKTIKLLKRDGYRVFALHSWTLDYLNGIGLEYEVEFDPDPQSHSYRLERSIDGHVAFNPDALYIPESDHRSLSQQEEKARELDIDRQLSQKYPGVKIEIGHVTDWLAIAYVYSITNNGKPLFREVGKWLRTQSATDVEKTANIGIKQNPLNPHERIISVTQSPYFMPNPALHAAYFLRAA